jgi:beta-lactamase regulating signal transducer with metallopeptidase domain/DUF4097 and DUF4098 domain-containing protein YvlB
MILLMLKATLVFLAGGLTALCLHRRSAALRHLVWTVTLSAAIVLAFATPILPDIAISTPEWAAVAVTEPAPFPNSLVEPTTAEQWPAEALRPSASVEPPRSTIDIRVLVWLGGSVAILCWCLLGRLGLARLLRRAERFEDPSWLDDLRTAGAPDRLRLYISPAIGSPATWGLFRPVIVLPPAARDWTAERRRVVLAHELAHVARGDGVANLIGWMACALYWPNPLAWITARRLRAEAERAADDHVLSRGVPPLEYAAHLLDVARGSRSMRLLGVSAIGMARPSSLEGRLLAVLDETRKRNVPRITARRASWTACAGLVLPLAVLTPSGEPAPIEREKPFVQSDTTFESSYPARPGEKLTLDLRTGGSVEIAGWDEPTVRIRAWMRGPSRRLTTVEMWHRGPGIRLRTGLSETRSITSTNHRFEIRVPRRYDVEIKSAGGGLTISGVEGTFTGHTGGGALRIDHARGVATLGTGGGDVSVSDSELDGRVTTGGGTVTLSRVSGGLRGHSGSGPVMRVGDKESEKGDLTGVTVSGDRITMNEPRTGRGMLHIEKAGGSVDLARAPEGADVRTGGGQIRIGESARMVKASTGGGDITIGPVDGSIEAFSGAGTLRATVVSENASVEYTTGMGSAIITLPRGFTGRFDLETAYTRGNPRTRIEAEWGLSEEETDEWDTSEGSPRKYVRASGKAGNGSGVIRIAVVNGDITIRRAR